MFVVLIRYKKALDVVEQYLLAHRSYLDECYKKNLLLVSGPQNPRTGGVLVSPLADRAQLDIMLANDPFYLNGVVDFEVIEFTPVKYHPLIETLIQVN